MKTIHVKRIYDPAAPSDGTRILVDRLWPRGISRDEAHLDGWAKDAAPSHELRRWYSHDRGKWSEFRTRYLAELQQNPAAAELRTQAGEVKTMTLLFAAKDPARNNAIILREFLEGGTATRRH
ncbi:MAG TPA: DUF488 family protein [Methylocella sp.]|nr:DUF488 family protein [Methylocella sp.]